MAEQNSIIRVEQDGVEFFTLAKTGESGMSVSGLAIAGGVKQQQVSKLLSDLTTKSPSKWLNHLVGTDLNLTTGVKRGGTTRVLKAHACSAILRHYAFSGIEKSQDFLVKLEDFGMEAMIQRITGWTPPSEVDQFIDRHILREPRSWECVFDRQWIRAAEFATGWSWGDPCMRHCINLLVYNRLPVEVRQRLDQINPVLPTGHRAKKQHQFFSDESVEQVLKMQLEIGRGILLVSTSWDEVKENSRRRFEGMAQMRLIA